MLTAPKQEDAVLVRLGCSASDWHSGLHNRAAFNGSSAQGDGASGAVEGSAEVLCISPYPHYCKDRPTNPCLYWVGRQAGHSFNVEEAAGTVALRGAAQFFFGYRHFSVQGHCVLEGLPMMLLPLVLCLTRAGRCRALAHLHQVLFCSGDALRAPVPPLCIVTKQQKLYT
jgi:hypothetical protein